MKYWKYWENVVFSKICRTSRKFQEAPKLTPATQKHFRKHNTTFEKLRQAEDSYVDELYNEASEIGAILLKANFPRSYIDPNRAETDFSLSEISDFSKDILKNMSKKERRRNKDWANNYIDEEFDETEEEEEEYE